jgi:hypothetical protein
MNTRKNNKRLKPVLIKTKNKIKEKGIELKNKLKLKSK